MASLKQIRQRIKTAKNIRQITRAMKLVAAARLTKAKNRTEEARPYSEKMREFIGSIGAGGDQKKAAASVVASGKKSPIGNSPSIHWR